MAANDRGRQILPLTPHSHRATETERQWQQHSSGLFSCDDEEQITLDDTPPHTRAESPGQFWDGTRTTPIRRRRSLTTSPNRVQPAQRNVAGAKGTSPCKTPH